MVGGGRRLQRTGSSQALLIIVTQNIDRTLPVILDFQDKLETSF